MFDTYIKDQDIEESGFQEIAEMYFNNYLTAWCDLNHLDEGLKIQIVRVLTDYSSFFMDSIIHDLNDRIPDYDDLKN